MFLRCLSKLDLREKVFLHCLHLCLLIGLNCKASITGLFFGILTIGSIIISVHMYVLYNRTFA
jgi:hypothetical protein